MTSTYRSGKSRDQAIADEYLGNFMACSKCGVATEVRTLSNLGAQCERCFDAYCARFTPAAPKRLSTADLKAKLKALSDPRFAAVAAGLRGGGE